MAWLLHSLHSSVADERAMPFGSPLPEACEGCVDDLAASRNVVGLPSDWLTFLARSRVIADAVRHMLDRQRVAAPLRRLCPGCGY